MEEMKIQLKPNPLLQETEKYYEAAVLNHTQAWQFIFECLGLDVNN